MFDIFLTYDFNAENRENNSAYKFSENLAYTDIKYMETSIHIPNGYVTWLERNDIDNNYLKFGSKHFLIYGSVFTNNKLKNTKDIEPQKVIPSTLYTLYDEYGESVVSYLKGSFVIVIIDEKHCTIHVFTDRLNVLPLYYCLKGKLLVISSSVNMIMQTGLVSSEIDGLALTEQLLFDYMLRDHYFYKDIRQTENARIYTFNLQGLVTSVYWSVEELYHEKLLPRKGSLELLSKLLFDTINLYSADRQKVLVSFTGGFDGRTNVAMIRKPQNDYLCYSYGKLGSKQIAIPEEISKKLNINYRPIYLEDHFEQQYKHNAYNAIEFSNGTAPVIRAIYPFVYKQLQEYSDLIITGLFGSEILRPLHNLGIQINDRSESIFLDDNYPNAIKKAIDHVKSKNYINPKLLTSSIDEVIKEFRTDYFDKYKNYDKITRFFFFIIQEGIRKYFMQEIQIERVYVTTRFPYLDDDLIELVYKTTYAGMYNGFLGKSKIKRRKGQLLYAHILRKYKPELGNLLLDRGYSSDDLLRPFPFNYFHILKGVYYSKKYIKKHGNDTFDSKKWTRKTFEHVLNQINDSEIFNTGLNVSFENGSYLNDLLTFSHLIALSKFTKDNQKLQENKLKDEVSPQAII